MKKNWMFGFLQKMDAPLYFSSLRKEFKRFRALVGKLNELKCTLYDTRENDREHSALNFVVARL